MVRCNNGSACGLSTQTTQQTTSSLSPVCSRENTSIVSEAQHDGCISLHEAVEKSGLPEESCNIIMQSWSSGTRQQYGSYIRKWSQFTNRESIDPLCPQEAQLIKFLQCLFNEGLGYSTINTAKSAVLALMSCGTYTISDTRRLDRFMKGLAFARPSHAKYISTWDPDIVLKYIASLPSNSKLSLGQLTRKLAMLAALVSGQRAQTLHCLDISSMVSSRECACFSVTKRLKTTTVNSKPLVVHFPRFRENDQLCVRRCLRTYLEKTASHRKDGESALFLTTQKPFKPAARDTVRNWIRTMMKLAGIDVTSFKVHSSRSASTSKAANSLPLNTIMKAAGWSSASTFAKHYHKPLQDHSAFAKAVLRPTKPLHRKGLMYCKYVAGSPYLVTYSRS